MEGLILLVAIGLVQGLIGYWIGKGKGRGTAGFWWGALLGAIGWIVVACLQPSMEVQAKRMALQARMMREAMRDED